MPNQFIIALCYQFTFWRIIIYVIQDHQDYPNLVNLIDDTYIILAKRILRAIIVIKAYCALLHANACYYLVAWVTNY